MSERPSRLEGGACNDLAPGIAAKYFDINTSKQPFEARTAKAICGRCAIQAVCLEAAINKKPSDLYGVIAGHTANEIVTIRRWREYDLGITDQEPPMTRPVTVEFQPSEARQAGLEYRRNADLSFEERVRGVFLDLRAGKYNETGGISQAIGAIAFIREQMAANEAASNRATA